MTESIDWLIDSFFACLLPGSPSNPAIDSLIEVFNISKNWAFYTTYPYCKTIRTFFQAKNALSYRQKSREASFICDFEAGQPSNAEFSFLFYVDVSFLLFPPFFAHLLIFVVMSRVNRMPSPVSSRKWDFISKNNAATQNQPWCIASKKNAITGLSLLIAGHCIVPRCSVTLAPPP